MSNITLSKKFDKVTEFSLTLEDLTSSYDLYILFIDLCNSTAFKQYCLENSMPDSIWIMRQNIFLARTASIIMKYNGTIVKTIGDEVMATFDITVNPDRILKGCIETFQVFEGLKAYNKDNFRIKSKASIDFGTCYNVQIMRLNLVDPIGSCVDRCARISKYAEPNQIVFSSDFFNICREKNIDLSIYNISEHEDELKGLGVVKFYKTEI